MTGNRAPRWLHLLVVLGTFLLFSTLVGALCRAPAIHASASAPEAAANQPGTTADERVQAAQSAARLAGAHCRAGRGRTW